MIKATDIKSTIYTMPCDNGDKSYLFIVEIREFSDQYEAWINIHGYGMAEFMFGMPKKHEDGTENANYDEFVELVEANFDDYAMPYIGAYGE